VTDIKVVFDMDDLDYRVPVLVEIDRERLLHVEGGKEVRLGAARDVHEDARRLIERGLRAQLQTRSFVTGMLQVSLDFYPGTEARLVGAPGEHPEIPTIPSSMEEISHTLESLPIKELVANLQHVAQGIDELVTSPRLEDAATVLEETLGNLRDLSKEARSQVHDVGGSVRGAVEEVRTTVQNLDRRTAELSSSAQAALDEGRRLARDADEQIFPLASRLEAATESAEEVLDETRALLAQAGGAGPAAPGLPQDASDALKELAAAARAIQALADYLERHPEALLHGKGGR
jgi:paraquat-inducible protein B